MATLRELADTLIIEITNKLAEAERLETWAATLTARDLQLREKERTHRLVDERLLREQEENEKEKAFIKEALARIEGQKQLEEAVTKKRLALAEEQAKMAKEREVNEKTRQSLQTLQDDLETRKSQLDSRESLLLAAERTQHARAAILDQQEEANRRETTRLQEIAQRFTTRK